MDKSPAELSLEIYNILLPYESDVRKRVVQSALTLLGESNAGAMGQSGLPVAGIGFDDVKLGPKAIRWLQKHAVSREMLDEIYHLSDGAADIIANSVPGASKREMTVNCYLLSGIRGLLKDDAPLLDETEAIAVCKRLTAYDKNNHTSHRQAVGNRMTGNKPRFTLTGPGESAAAELIRQMTSSTSS
ncbi:MAG TPA: hypothetical protein VHY19_00335 [Steroidobacteraceae bacterium]|jgi:hypothetical protein|nr:hypothetical protein [Steroidobacteraceae bacterium]